MHTIQNILIIQTAFIGDVILTTPLIEVLKKEFPEVVIDFLTIPTSKGLLDSNPNIRNLIIFDKRGKDKGFKGLFRIGRQLENNNYDLCLCPHRSLRSAILARKSNAKVRIGFNRSAWRKAFTHIVAYDQKAHEIERNLSLLSVIGLDKERSIPVLYATEEDKKNVQNHIDNLNITDRKLLAVAAGSVWPTKRWPDSYYSELCKRMTDHGFHILLIGGIEDQPLCDRISRGSEYISNLSGKMNLRETFYLLKQCIGILTNDSAPLHLGMAAKTNVFAIFGPTVPEFGFAPFGPNSYIFENQDLNCRPCAIHGSKKCPVKTFDCMNTIQPERVSKKIIEFLKHKPDIQE